jgi:predicted NBD/HSP70 family sugar kinase
MRSGTNLPRVRDYNQGVVLEAIRVGNGVSRVEIAENTGLTAQTVSNIVRRLLDDDLVIEDGVDPSGRKPRVKLRIKPDSRYAIGALIDRDETSLVLMDLDGRIVGRESRPVDQKQGAQGVLDQVAEATETLVHNASVDPNKVLGVGLGCPGPMDHDQGILYEPLDLFGWNWHEVALKQDLSGRIGLPVIVDNDATAAAVGERWVGGAQGVRNFAYIFMSMGLGAGIFIENQLYRGDTTNAGELGHMSINIDGPLCFCGNRGCLEIYCSPVRILSAVRLRLQQGEPSSLADLPELTLPAIRHAALTGDPVALEEVRYSARMLANGMVNLVSLLDLRLIVLGGRHLAEVGPIYQKEVERALNNRLLTRNLRKVKVELSLAGQDAGAVGAAALVLHEIFAPRLTELNMVSQF